MSLSAGTLQYRHKVATGPKYIGPSAVWKPSVIELEAGAALDICLER